MGNKTNIKSTREDIFVLKTDMDSNINTVLSNGKTMYLNIQESNFQVIVEAGEKFYYKLFE